MIDDRLKESLELEQLIKNCDPKFKPDVGALARIANAMINRPSPRGIIIDVDHTLTHAHWRDGMIGGEWDDYHAAAKHDRPIWSMINLVSTLAMASHWKVVALTSRPEKWRQSTIEWFYQHGVLVDVILMRPNDNYDPSAVLKIKMAKAHFGEPLSEHVAMVIDDSEAICAAFAAEGVPSLQIYSRIIK